MKPILLLQARKSDKVRDHELRCFQKAVGKTNLKAIKNINVYGVDSLSGVKVENFRSVIVGGSPHNPKDDFPLKGDIFQLIEEVMRKDVPFLGVCFGFEMLVEATGGEVKPFPEGDEIGTVNISLTKTGRKESLFKNFKQSFTVQEAHGWYASSVGKKTEVLAKDEKNIPQAIKTSFGRAYGVQFHPELGKKEMGERFDISMSGGFTKTGQGITKPVHPTPEAKMVIRNFLELE